jgi:predicted PurR-regulated permease PerM
VARVGWVVDDDWRRRISAGLATGVLLAVIVSPILLLLATSLDGVAEVWTVLSGLALRDEAQVARVAEVVAREVRAMQAFYPDLPLDADEVRYALIEGLGRSRGGALYGYLFRGTGGVLAQLVLGVVLIYAFYSEGAKLVHRLLDMLPFDERRRGDLTRRFRHIVLRLLNDTVAMALAKGLALGALAWLIAGYNLSVVAAVATFIGLVPVVGHASVWLPLSGVLWQRGLPASAVGLAAGSLASAWLIERIGMRLTKRLDPHGAWMGFLLFLGLIGGVLSFGVKGLVIGPAAVVILVVLVGFWLPLYGVGEPILEPPPEQPPAL